MKAVYNILLHILNGEWVHERQCRRWQGGISLYLMDSLHVSRTWTRSGFRFVVKIFTNSGSTARPNTYIFFSENWSFVYVVALLVKWLWWSYRRGETTSLNCGHRQAYCLYRIAYIWAWRPMVEWYRHGKTPDSFTRALWKSYQQIHLVAKQEVLDEGSDEFGQ
jgi:hypothetical protein